MVFVGDGGTKEGKDAIAGGLSHIALVAMDRVHHELQGGIDQAAGVFGVEVFDERHRALDVGKEGGDGLAFAVYDPPGLHGSLLGPDTLGEMARSIANGSRVCGQWKSQAELESRVRTVLDFGLWTLDLGLTHERSATFPTEPGLGQILNPAARTAVLKGDSTPDAELHPLGVGQATRGAVHAASLLPWSRSGKRNAGEFCGTLVVQASRLLPEAAET